MNDTIQDVLQKIRGVLVAGHALRQPIGLCDFVGELDFETIVVEAVGMVLLHPGEFKVVGGDDARNREGGN